MKVGGLDELVGTMHAAKLPAVLSHGFLGPNALSKFKCGCRPIGVGYTRCTVVVRCPSFLVNSHVSCLQMWKFGCFLLFCYSCWTI